MKPFGPPLDIRLSAIALMLVALVSVDPAAAVVLHPNDNPTSLPPVDVVGRWGNGASVVAIDSQHVITTRHQGGGEGASIQIGGQTYQIAELTILPDNDNPGNAPDLRVARLETLSGQVANLTNYVELYTGTDEAGKTVAIGGVGEGRGADITTGFGRFTTTIGYEWDGSIGTLRWGANRIDGSEDAKDFGAFTNDVLSADFDGPSASTKVDGEATLAAGDSGGGWFIDDNGTWKLAGLTQGVENVDEALFNEDMTAVRISSYIDEILAAIRPAGDVDLDGDVDNLDLGTVIGNFTGDGGSSILTRADGDVDGDGDVDEADFSIVAADFTGALTEGQLASMAESLALLPGADGSPTAPEPTTFVLLGLGVVCLTRRRRRGA